MKKTIAAVLASLAVAALAAAQATQPAPSANPLADAAKLDYGMVRMNLIKSADQVPESLYGFRPTPDVRTFGQLFGHLADDNYLICSAAAGEKPPAEGIEKSKTAKADLVKALADSLAYCDKVFAALTDAEASKPVPFFGRQMPRLSILAFNTSHDNLHYGNLITYLRLNKMVPPSSQPRK